MRGNFIYRRSNMVMRWSLQELYPSFESNEYKNDLKEVDKEIEKMEEWVDSNSISKNRPVEKLEEYIKLNLNFRRVFTRLMTFANLTTSVDANNDKAAKAIDILQMKNVKLTEPAVKFQNWLGTFDNIEEIIDKSNLLKQHKFYILELKEKSKYLLDQNEEKIIAYMSNTGSKAWSKLQKLLSSTLLVDLEIDGEVKKLPLPVVRNMAYSKDSQIRERGYYAELKSYEKIAQSSAACLNGIKGEVITVSKMRGYNSPLEETLINSRMDKKTLDSMFIALKESLPAFHKYYRAKGKYLGHENGLPFYDIQAPVGSIDRQFSYDEARKYIVKNFRTFSEGLADFADHAFENRWIDAEPREGKRGGAFCSNIHAIGESRIMTNFNGSFSNVITLAHELGHGYHGSLLAKESILNSSYPMPLAETASTFCETIVMNAALKEASKEESISLLESSISDAGQVIVDIYSRFLFESELFKRRINGSLSVNELKEIMIEAQKEAYGDGLDHNYLHPYMWVNKPHYYYGSRNFYNFPYAFGLLLSKGLYAQYLEEGKDFVEKYDEFLKATGKNNIEDVTSMVGIDVQSVEFWRGSLKLIEEDIEKFINII